MSAAEILFFWNFLIDCIVHTCVADHIPYPTRIDLAFYTKAYFFQMILLWSAFCIGRNKIYYIMHVLNDNNYGMKNVQFHFNDSLLFFLKCNFLRDPRILLQTSSNLNWETCWIFKLLLFNIGNECVAKYGNI